MYCERDIDIGLRTIYRAQMFYVVKKDLFCLTNGRNDGLSTGKNCVHLDHVDGQVRAMTENDLIGPVGKINSLLQKFERKASWKS